MNPTTKEFLRNAAVDALAKGNDESAFEILSILQTNPASLSITATPALLPARVKISAQKGHSIEFFTRIVRMHFLPYLKENGRISFRSVELRTWIECNQNIQLNEADWEPLAHNHLRWKKTLSSALNQLKKMGILGGEQNCQSYVIL